MDPDWSTLAPHRPLVSGSDQYVPTGNADTLAGWVLASASVSTLLIGGPVGIGKSTELSAMDALMQGKRAACIVRLDRSDNMRRITAEQVLVRITAGLVSFATKQLNLKLSDGLRTSVMNAELAFNRDPSTHPDLTKFLERTFIASGASLLRSALEEVVRLHASGRVVLLIDGLEKVPPGPGCLEIFDALGKIGDNADLVVVVPWHMAYGPRDDLVRPGERFWSQTVREVEGPHAGPGRELLSQILLRRLPGPYDMPEGFTTLVDAAAVWSGGLPRTFLQLVADAATYARIRKNEPWPDQSDLGQAVADQQDSFRRVLLAGDLDAIRTIEGTDGVELDLGRKVRLLAHGVLLERSIDTGHRLDVHPLVAPLLKRGPRA